MATVFITQKIDHRYDDLTHNPKADALIFLPESAGVNSAGQVISIFNDSSSASASQRYAVIVTGTRNTGELTVTGNFDRHTSFNYTISQELADGSLSDGNNIPVRKWQAHHVHPTGCGLLPSSHPLFSAEPASPTDG